MLSGAQPQLDPRPVSDHVVGVTVTVGAVVVALPAHDEPLRSVLGSVPLVLVVWTPTDRAAASST
jgi:hypothetical protein